MEKPRVLENAPLHFAPTNEMGVVYLFAHHAKRLGLIIDEVRPSFPDCIARQKTQDGEKPIRIEFEFKSKNFKLHRHNSKKCDWIVCWEHNWPDAPEHLKIIELRREYGLGFNVWICPVTGEYKEVMNNLKRSDVWSAPSQANKDDLILYYFASPEKCIKHIFKVTKRPKKQKAGWKPGTDYMANISRVAVLKSPIFLDDMRNDRILSTANFVRGQMQGRLNASEYWPYIHSWIIKRNPTLKMSLRKFAPHLNI